MHDLKLFIILWTSQAKGCSLSIRVLRKTPCQNRLSNWNILQWSRWFYRSSQNPLTSEPKLQKSIQKNDITDNHRRKTLLQKDNLLQQWTQRERKYFLRTWTKAIDSLELKATIVANCQYNKISSTCTQTSLRWVQLKG